MQAIFGGLFFLQAISVPQGEVKFVNFERDLLFDTTGEIRAFFDNEPAPVFESGGLVFVLIAADFRKDTGEYRLEIKLKDIATFTTGVSVTLGNFQRTVINRPYTFVNLPKSTRDSIERKREPLLTALRKGTKNRLWVNLFNYPLDSISVSSRFGSQRIYRNYTSYHRGTDLKGEAGEKVKALSEGRVLWAEENEFYFEGNIVVIDHGEGIVSMYMHLSKALVRTGDTVSIGQNIGEIGSTGHSTGPHLHLTIKVGSAYVDPLLFIETFQSLRFLEGSEN